MKTYERRKKRDVKVNEADEYFPPNSSYPQKPSAASEHPIFQCPSNSNLPHHQDLHNLSNLRRIETDNMEGGRNKRNRKPKLHFDISYSKHADAASLCFREHCCDPEKQFQEALKQSLAHLKENSAKGLTAPPEGSEDLNVPDQLHDMQNLSNSSRTETDNMETRRGKRNRKPKLHFDALAHQKEPSAKELIASPQGSEGLNVPDQLHDSQNLSNANRTEIDNMVGRGKRIRKPKLHFDEINVPDKKAGRRS